MLRSAFVRGAGREADGGAGAVGFQAALLTELVQEEFRGQRQALNPAAGIPQCSQEALLPLRAGEIVKPDLEAEPSQHGGIQAVHEIRGAQEKPAKALHLGQQLIDLSNLPGPMSATPVLQETVGL